MPADPASVSISIENRLAEIGRVADLLDRYAAAQRLGQTVLNDMHVAVDEALSNICRHAFCDAATHRIDVHVFLDPGAFVVQIEDEGIAFDPTAQPLQVSALPAACRPVGGLGLVFMRSVLDAVEYERMSGRNVLRLRKCVPAQPERASEPEALHVDETVVAGQTVIAPRGRIDSAGAPILRERLLRYGESQGARIVLDLAQVSYLTSAGFWAMLSGARSVQHHGGELVLCGVTAELGKLFDAGCFRELFRIFATRELALQAGVGSASGAEAGQELPRG